MNNSMFTEQDNLARSADEPLAVLMGTCSPCLAKCQFLHGTTDRVGNPDIIVRSERDCASFNQGMAEIVKQICRILDSDTETDQILGETASRAGGRVDRSMTGE